MNPIHNWTKGEPVKITCEISAYDSVSLTALNFQPWSDIIGKRLREAGIPVDEAGILLRGKIHRFDDPKDLSRTIYEWSAGE